jgi:hypothetical protein
MKKIQILFIVFLITVFSGVNGSYAADGAFDGVYSIIASHSGKAVDTWEWGTTDGTNIAQYNYWGGDAQRFNITAVDGTWYTISPVISTSQAVEVANGSVNAGANIQTFNNWGHACQQWRFEEGVNGGYLIVNRNSNMCMSVADSSMDDGANVEQSDCVDTPNRTFTLIKHDVPVPDGNNWCLEDINSFRPGQGPFDYRRVVYGNVKMWVPELPEGCKAPMVHFSNGTYGNCDANYASILQNLAEYGFMALCYEDMNTGQGTQALQAIDTAINRYPNLVDTTKMGFTGHSQGGAGTFTALYRAERKYGSGNKYTGVAMQPAAAFGSYPANWAQMFGDINSPVAMFNGSYDTLVPQYYAQITWNALPNDVPKVWYTATGLDSTHIPTPNNPGRQITIPWFYWMLLGNQDACQAFKNLPRSGPGQWRELSSRNLPACN